jgi:hypothetical protein
MNITIQTPEGTYIVPPDKYTQFIGWLNSNAIKVSPSQPVREVQQPFDYNNPSVLLNE